MKKRAIVITTIQKPTEAVKKFSKYKEFQLYVAGDRKTDSKWTNKNTIFLSIEDQIKKYSSLAKNVPENTYVRKNFAYLEAVKDGCEYLFETDDDNLPYDFFPNFFEDDVETIELHSPPYFNILGYFTKEKIWPRGLPLTSISETKAKKSYKSTVSPLIQQSLADLDPDVDAIYRLTQNKEVKFKKNLVFSLSKNTYCPINSQNTYWHKKVFPLLYLPFTVSFRATDMWRGFVAQRILWEMGSRLLYLSPGVYQKRNKHELMRDFKDELDVYTKTDQLLSLLTQLKLRGDVSSMLYEVYQALVTNKFVEKEELTALKKWLQFF